MEIRRFVTKTETLNSIFFVCDKTIDEVIDESWIYARQLPCGPRETIYPVIVGPTMSESGALRWQVDMEVKQMFDLQILGQDP